MTDRAAKILLVALIVLALIALLMSIYKATAPVPLTGYVTEKTYHPAYFPATAETPWVYCVVIQDEEARCCTAWQVPKAVYDRYTVGQHVQRGLW